MGTVVKVKLANCSLIPVVRFIGVQFDGSLFLSDVASDSSDALTNVHNGLVGLTAFRVSDGKAVGMLTYPISDEMGFAAVAVDDVNDPDWPCKLVGEPFSIPSS